MLILFSSRKFGIWQQKISIQEQRWYDINHPQNLPWTQYTSIRFVRKKLDMQNVTQEPRRRDRIPYDKREKDQTIYSLWKFSFLANQFNKKYQIRGRTTETVAKCEHLKTHEIIQREKRNTDSEAKTEMMLTKLGIPVRSSWDASSRRSSAPSLLSRRSIARTPQTLNFRQGRTQVQGSFHYIPTKNPNLDPVQNRRQRSAVGFPAYQSCPCFPDQTVELSHLHQKK